MLKIAGEKENEENLCRLRGSNQLPLS